MEIQELIVGVIFLLAIYYVSKMLIRNFRSDKGCASGCGKCGIDFSEEALKKQQKG